MPRYKFRLLRQMSVDGQQRDVGALVPEAAMWPNVRNYLNLEWIEKLPAAEDDLDGVEFPPVSPQSRLAQVLEPERERPQEIVASSRKQTKASKAVRCRNCRVRNWLPASFSEERTLAVSQLRATTEHR